MEKPYLPLIIFALFIFSCAQEKKEYLLNEEFNSNELGWIEENKTAHEVEIRNGEYFISSIDTSYGRTSVNSMNDHYLYHLPKIYVITTSIHFSGDYNDSNNFGLLLYSASLEYKFSVYASGKVIVMENDYNKDYPEEIISSELKYNAGRWTQLKIVINEEHFEFFINDELVGANKFKCKTTSWRDLRIYASSTSSILVDYLKIKEY